MDKEVRSRGETQLRTLGITKKGVQGVIPQLMLSKRKQLGNVILDDGAVEEVLSAGQGQQLPSLDVPFQNTAQKAAGRAAKFNAGTTPASDTELSDSQRAPNKRRSTPQNTEYSFS